MKKLMLVILCGLIIHGADSQSGRVENTRHGTSRLHVEVQPGRDRFQILTLESDNSSIGYEPRNSAQSR